MKEEKDSLEKFFGDHLEKGSFEYDEAQWEIIAERLDVVSASNAGGLLSGGSANTLKIVGAIAVVGAVSFFTGWYLRGDELRVASADEIAIELKIDEAPEAENNGDVTLQDVSKENDKSTNSQFKAGISSTQSSFNVESNAVNPTATTQLIDKSDKTNLQVVVEKELGQVSSDKATIPSASSSIVSNDHQKIGDQSAKQESVGDADVRPIAEESGETGDAFTTVPPAVNQTAQKPLVGQKAVASGTNSTIDTPSIPSSTSDISLAPSSSLTSAIDNSDTKEMEPSEVGMIVPVLIESPGEVEPLIPMEFGESTEAVRTNTPIWGRFAFTLLFAPDFNSTTPEKLFESLSESVGVKAHYYLDERIQVGTGFIVNNKIYSAGPDDYSPESGFWTYKVAPEKTDATCLMIDIPVEVGYRLFGNNVRSLWANVGMTNYWVLSQHYKYNYENSNPHLIQEWEDYDNAFSAVSSLNFSVSYISSVSPKFSLVLEPYFKTPLKGLGNGSVLLLSSGMNLGIRFRNKKIIVPQ